jgi:hypothetical protein
MPRLLPTSVVERIETKLLTDLEPLSNLIQNVPTKPVPKFTDAVKKIKYVLKNSAKKTAKTATPELAEIEEQEITIPINTYKSPIIELEAYTIEAAKHSNIPIEEAINTDALYDFIETRNKAIIDILKQTPTVEDVTWSSAELQDRVNSLWKLIQNIKAKKIPVIKPVLILNPLDVAQLNFNAYLQSGLKAISDDLKIKIIECSEVEQGTGFLYEYNPRVLYFPIAEPVHLVKIDPDTDPPEVFRFYLKERWGGAILHEGGVIKLNIK